MKARDILKSNKHRSFTFPEHSWKYYQEWNKAIFLHWQVNLELVTKWLPDNLEIDTIDGATWVSLVAFDMNNIGVRSLPKLPHISDFHEINIRLYVKYKGKPSVYFLSMEGSKKSSCKILRTLSKFPYRYSEMNRAKFSFESKNEEFKDDFFIEYRLGDQSQKDETDYWLTERYAVFQDYKSNIIEYDVHHVEWPIQSLLLKKLKINYPRFNHILNNQPDRVHYSEGVQVLTWDKKKHRHD